MIGMRTFMTVRTGIRTRLRPPSTDKSAGGAAVLAAVTLALNWQLRVSR